MLSAGVSNVELEVSVFFSIDLVMSFSSFSAAFHKVVQTCIVVQKVDTFTVIESRYDCSFHYNTYAATN